MHGINSFRMAKVYTCKNNKNLIERETYFRTVWRGEISKFHTCRSFK